uniref:Uncharacterized protein n=1 Tax=Aegilops tauschii subsp. strangulata TaxID=200361 RepID=A0A453S2S2_AEGTS
MNQEDDAEETALPSAWYEVPSVLHMMAMLRLSRANSLLLPKTSLEGYHAKRTNALLSRYSLRRPGTWSALCSMFFLGCRPKRGKVFLWTCLKGS